MPSSTMRTRKCHAMRLRRPATRGKKIEKMKPNNARNRRNRMNAGVGRVTRMRKAVEKGDGFIIRNLRNRTVVVDGEPGRSPPSLQCKWRSPVSDTSLDSNENPTKKSSTSASKRRSIKNNAQRVRKKISAARPSSSKADAKKQKSPRRENKSPRKDRRRRPRERSPPKYRKSKKSLWWKRRPRQNTIDKLMNVPRGEKRQQPARAIRISISPVAAKMQKMQMQFRACQPRARSVAPGVAATTTDSSNNQQREYGPDIHVMTLRSRTILVSLEKGKKTRYNYPNVAARSRHPRRRSRSVYHFPRRQQDSATTLMVGNNPLSAATSFEDRASLSYSEVDDNEVAELTVEAADGEEDRIWMPSASAASSDPSCAESRSSVENASSEIAPAQEEAASPTPALAAASPPPSAALPARAASPRRSPRSASPLMSSPEPATSRVWMASPTWMTSPRRSPRLTQSPVRFASPGVAYARGSPRLMSSPPLMTEPPARFASPGATACPRRSPRLMSSPPPPSAFQVAARAGHPYRASPRLMGSPPRIIASPCRMASPVPRPSAGLSPVDEEEDEFAPPDAPRSLLPSCVRDLRQEERRDDDAIATEIPACSARDARGATRSRSPHASGSCGRNGAAEGAAHRLSDAYRALSPMFEDQPLEDFTTPLSLQKIREEQQSLKLLASDGAPAKERKMSRRKKSTKLQEPERRSRRSTRGKPPKRF